MSDNGTFREFTKLRHLPRYSEGGERPVCPLSPCISPLSLDFAITPN